MIAAAFRQLVVYALLGVLAFVVAMVAGSVLMDAAQNLHELLRMAGRL